MKGQVPRGTNELKSPALVNFEFDPQTAVATPIMLGIFIFLKLHQFRVVVYVEH